MNNKAEDPELFRFYRTDSTNKPMELYRIIEQCKAEGEGTALFDDFGACGTVSSDGEVRIW